MGIIGDGSAAFPKADVYSRSTQKRVKRDGSCQVSRAVTIVLDAPRTGISRGRNSVLKAEPDKSIVIDLSGDKLLGPFTSYHG